VFCDRGARCLRRTDRHPASRGCRGERLQPPKVPSIRVGTPIAPLTWLHDGSSPLFECTAKVTVLTEMGMSPSVLRVDRFTSPIPIPRRRSFIATKTETGESVSSEFTPPSLLRFHCHFFGGAWSPQAGETLDMERVADDL